MGDCSDDSPSSKSAAASAAGSNEAPEDHEDYANFGQLTAHMQHIWVMIRTQCSEYAHWFSDYSAYCNQSIKRYGFSTVEVLTTREHFVKWMKLCKARFGSYLRVRHRSTNMKRIYIFSFKEKRTLLTFHWFNPCPKAAAGLSPTHPGDDARPLESSCLVWVHGFDQAGKPLARAMSIMGIQDPDKVGDEPSECTPVPPVLKKPKHADSIGEHIRNNLLRVVPEQTAPWL